MELEDWATVIRLILALVFVVFIFVYVGLSLDLSAQCAEMGWPEYRITWNLEKYCVKRVNQTDYIKLLSEIK